MRRLEGKWRPDRLLNTVPGTSKTKAPEQTFEEVRYLRHLSESRVPVRIRLTDNSEVAGIVEFYDVDFIRLTSVIFCKIIKS